MKIHILSNSPNVNSGFSRVAVNLAVELKKLGHDIAFTGLQTTASAWLYRDIPIHPIVGDINEAVYPELLMRGLARNMRMHGSEALLCLYTPLTKNIMFTQVHPNTVWYVSLEERLIYKHHLIMEAAKKVKKIVAMNHSAGEQFKRYGIDSTVIYHGYDPGIYHKGFDKSCEEPATFYIPANNTEVVMPARAIPEFWEKLGIDFLVGFVGQNNGVRKRIELLIEAFSIFAKDKGNEVHLHLHTLPNYVTGINLIEVIEYFNVKDRVTFSYGDWRSSGWAEEALNILYNTFDVFATASSGEGFGLPLLESMAAGIPQVAPNYMPFDEFIGNSERGLLAKGREQFIQTGGYRFLVDPVDMAQQMQTLYENRQMRDKLGRNAEKWAKDFTWPKLAEKWNELLLQG